DPRPPARSGEWRRERDHFEEPYGRSAWQADDRGGRSIYGSRRDDDFPRNLDDYRNRPAWQPGLDSSDSRRAQHGDTDYGGYGPRYGSSYSRSDESGRAPTGGAYGSYGNSLYGGYGDERSEGGYGRRGPGEPHEDSRHEFEPEYRQWRDEQIR